MLKRLHAQTQRALLAFPVGAAARVVALALLAKGLALGRELEIARRFGLSASVDAFVLASTMTFFVGKMGANSLLVCAPKLIVDCQGQSTRDCSEADLYRSSLLAAVGLTLAAALVLPAAARLFFAAEARQAMTIRLLLWLLPAVMGWTLLGGLGGVSNAQGRYGAYQAGLLVSEAAVLAVVWLMASRAGIVAVAWGWCLGLWLSVAGLILCLWPYLTQRWVWGGWRQQWRSLRVLWARAGGVLTWFVLSQAPVWCEQYFAARLAPGALSALSYAQNLFTVPVELVGAIVSSVWVPEVARMLPNEVGNRTLRLLQALALVGLPGALGVASLARPAVSLVYARGAFDARAVSMTAAPFAMYALGLGFHALSLVLIRTFQGRGESRYPVIAAVIDVVLTGTLDGVAASLGWGVTGIAAVNAATAAVRTGILFFYMRSRFLKASAPC